MGSRYQFECEKCGYSVMISGGDDAGMISRTTTIVCVVCQELYDIKVSDEPWDNQPSQEQIISCPVDASHVVERWTHPGSCPKCQGQMVRKDLMILWD